MKCTRCGRSDTNTHWLGHEMIGCDACRTWRYDAVRHSPAPAQDSGKIERAAVVSWLRKAGEQMCADAAAAIEAGEHLK